MPKYEIYKRTEGDKRTFLVFDFSFDQEERRDQHKQAKKYFHSASWNIFSSIAWTYRRGLYFEKPHKKAKKKIIYFYMRLHPHC